MKLRLTPTDLTEAGITDMTVEQLTIEKMIEAITEAPVPFLIDIDLDIFIGQMVYTVEIWNTNVDFSPPQKFNSQHLIDALFEAYQFVVGYEEE